MRPSARLSPAIGLGLLALSWCAGCTISVQPAWRSTVPAPPAAYPDGTPGRPLPPPQGMPPNPNLPPPGFASPDQISFMQQRLHSIEDEKKSYAARVQQLEVQLRDKDQAVVQTGFEVQESTKQLKRTREEVLRWKNEMDDLRARLRTIERENKGTLEAILKTLEQHLGENTKEPWKTQH